MDARRRAQLVTFGERGAMRRRRGIASVRSIGFGWLQAVFVANAFAALDGPDAGNPFHSADLRCVYDAQRLVLFGPHPND